MTIKRALELLRRQELTQKASRYPARLIGLRSLLHLPNDIIIDKFGNIVDGKLLLTAYRGPNAPLFFRVMNHHVPAGSSVLDATWGKGNFWKLVPPNRYRVIRNDLLQPGVDVRSDFRHLPFANATFDCVILDPPYARHGRGPLKQSIERCYANESAGHSEAEMIQIYRDGAAEAHRVLKPGGVLMLKTQDAVESGKQVWKHAELLRLDGFDSIEMFVLVQKSTPAMRHGYQLHARKNHSYLVVYRRAAPARGASSTPSGATAHRS